MSAVKNLWDDDYPPLDIKRVAEVLARELGAVYLRVMEKQVRLIQEHIAEGIPFPSPLLDFSDMKAQAQFMDKIIEVLTQYDAWRTQALKFYKQELIELHNVTLRPGLIVRVEENPGK